MADRDTELPPLAPDVVELHAPEDLPRDVSATVRERMASLQRYTDRPILSARLTLRRPETRAARMRWIADASLDVDGRLLAAHVTGRSPVDATDEAVDRLRRQLRRVIAREVALRNEPRMIAKELSVIPHEVVHRPEPDVKEPRRRRIAHRIRVPDEPTSTLDAIALMLDADQEFRLFREEITGAWLVVHRREDGRVGLIHPPWVPTHEDHGDLVVVEPSPSAEPLTVDQARAELEAGDRRFLYFVDAVDGRPKVLYLRHDGDYGLVEPDVPGAT
jgi:ribosome-associated translation inhibitor RaiA